MNPGQCERLGRLLAEMEEESGPIPPELLEEARKLWRPHQPVDRSVRVLGVDEAD